MPAENEGLGRSWDESFTEWLESKKASQLACPICKSGNFVLGDAFEAAAASTVDPVNFQAAYVYCDNCGYIMLFNADKIGLRLHG